MITLGVDLGGTNLRAARVAEDGALGAVRRVRLADRSPESVVSTLRTLVDEVLDQDGLTHADVLGLAVGTAGQIHGATGRVVVGPNLGWREVPFAAMLEEALPFRAIVVNDLSAAVWGERVVGAGAGADDVLMIAVGSGVGSGIVSGGHLLDGASGVAGEFGHTKVVPSGRLCGCGEHGCLEAYAGGHNLAARAAERIRELGHEGPLAEYHRAGRLDVEALHAAYLAGDAVAKELLGHAAELLGVASANYVTLLNPARLVLGGGVLLGCPEVARGLRAGIERYTSRSALADLEIALAALGDDAGLIGAGLLAYELLR